MSMEGKVLAEFPLRVKIDFLFWGKKIGEVFLPRWREVTEQFLILNHVNHVSFRG